VARRADGVDGVNEFHYNAQCDPPLPVMDKAAIRETLAGYAYASDVIERERITLLQHMTPEEARRIWQDLVASWEASSQPTEGLDRLGLWRVETLVAVRRAFEKSAHARGLA
jgi:hypothetical protein